MKVEVAIQRFVHRLVVRHQCDNGHTKALDSRHHLQQRLLQPLRCVAVLSIDDAAPVVRLATAQHDNVGHLVVAHVGPAVDGDREWRSLHMLAQPLYDCAAQLDASVP